MDDIQRPAVPPQLLGYPNVMTKPIQNRGTPKHRGFLMQNMTFRSVRRDVFSSPWLDADGRRMLVAVDAKGRSVGSSASNPGEDTNRAVSMLWELLDLVDPS